MDRYRTTPDSRYFLVRSRLWRKVNPDLPDATRQRLVYDLMAARRAVKVALKSKDGPAAELARRDVDVAKRALGERGSVCWTDGTPDYNRKMARSTPNADWFADQS